MEIIDETKQKKLDRLLSLLDPDNSLTKKDFEDGFRKVLELVQQILINQQNAIVKLQQDHARALSDMEYRHQGNYNDIKGQVDHVFVGDKLKEMNDSAKSRHEEMKSEMKEMMEEMMSKMHGKMGSMDEKGGKMDEMMSGMMSQMEAKMESMKPPTMPTEYFDMMKEVREELKKVKNVLENIPRGKAMGRAKVPMPRTIDLTSDQNGVARTFNIPPDTVRIFGGISSQFPFAIASSDISRNGNQITLSDTIAPRERTQTLLIFTDALFYP